MKISGYIQSFIHQYLEVSPKAEEIIADYALKTWLPVPPSLKYLQFVGGLNTGKTRAGAVMRAICKDPIDYFDMSSTSLITKLDMIGGTLLLNGDNLPNDSSIILRNGNVKGNRIIRVLEQDGAIASVNFNVYGYKVIFMRSKFQDPSLQSKCISIPLSGMTREEIPQILTNHFAREAIEIRDLIESHIDFVNTINRGAVGVTVSA